MGGFGGARAENTNNNGDLTWRNGKRGIRKNDSDEDIILHITSAHEGAQRQNGPTSKAPVTESQDSLPASTREPSLSENSKVDSKKVLYAEDENEERGNWSGRFDFILSMLGYAVGLGNIWRFPYLAYRNGGGAFLLPFLLMMVIIGLPLFFLEASLGQFCSAGPMACWQFAPLFKGLGIAMVVGSGLTTIYYNMILGWSLYYLFASFTLDLPWNTCEGPWNSEDCSLKLPLVTCDEHAQKDDGTCNDATSGEFLGLWNASLFEQATGRKRISPSEEYWNGKALSLSAGIDDLGQPKWDMSLCLMLAWIICFFCLLKGIKTTGKVVYFTAIFPYVVLFILLIRGATLDNAGEGIYYFIVPDFERLADARVWKDAANQIFFSMSIASGGLVTLSSYNRFHNNILRDSLIVALGDSLTCVLGGFVIFSFLGYMAGQLGVRVKDVVKDGAGLAFIVYPEAVSNLPPPTLWALLFFVMLLTLGLDSQFAMLETVLTGVLDQYPHLRPRKTLVVFVICCIFFLLGLPLACPGGIYLLQLMDNYVGGLTLIVIGFFEIVALIYVYGCNRFCNDIRIMIGLRNFIYWKVTWLALSPLTILFIFVFIFVDYSPSTYGDYTYPGWADALGWLMAAFSLIFIPICMIQKISKEREGSGFLELCRRWRRSRLQSAMKDGLGGCRSERGGDVAFVVVICLASANSASNAQIKLILQAPTKVRLLTTPSDIWGPALPKYRALVDYVENFEVDPYTRRAAEKGRTLHRTDTSSTAPIYTSQASLGLRTQSMVSGFSSLSARTSNSALTFESNV